MSSITGDTYDIDQSLSGIDDSALYLLITTAASTYQTLLGMASYLTNSVAASTYQTIANMSNYLTTATAASTYQTIANMSNYLTTATAASTYQLIANNNDIIVNTLTVGLGGGQISTNTTIGYKALNAVNTGGYNTSVGYLANSLDTSGNSNTAIGCNALKNNTIGVNNTAIGKDSMISYNPSTSAGLNVAVGENSGFALTNGTNNVCVGYNTARGMSTGSYNTAIGDSAFYNQNWSNSTAIGYNAQPTANNQVVLGTAAETVICPNSLSVASSLTVASTINTINLTAPTNSGLNVAYLGIPSTATGIYNTCLGYSSLYSLTSGTSNTIVGAYSGIGITTNGQNVGIGSGCLKGGNVNNTVGVGNSALASSTASNNTAVGNTALNASTTGSNNTAIGCNANITGNPSNSTAIGCNSSCASYTQSTAIGYNATATANNQIVLGTATETVICPNNINLAVAPTMTYTTLPTFINSQIGYTYNFKNTSAFTFPASGTAVQIGSGLSFPVGVYHFSGQFMSSIGNATNWAMAFNTTGLNSTNPGYTNGTGVLCSCYPASNGEQGGTFSCIFSVSSATAIYYFEVLTIGYTTAPQCPIGYCNGTVARIA